MKIFVWEKLTEVANFGEKVNIFHHYICKSLPFLGINATPPISKVPKYLGALKNDIRKNKKEFWKINPDFMSPIPNSEDGTINS